MLTGPSALYLLIAFGVLWASPSLDLGLLLDDRGHRDFVNIHVTLGEYGREAIDMFGLGRNQTTDEVLMKAYVGLLPWWTSHDFSVSFFRPLAVLTHYLDYGLWPEQPLLMHAHNLLWYGAMLLLVGLLYRRVLGAVPAAALALLLFAIDEAHVEGAAWLAGRNTLMTGVFMTATLLVYDRGRRDGLRHADWLAPLLLLLGFASSEGTIAVWAYLLPYALLLDRAPVRERIASLIPMLAITACWQMLYRGMGYGARGSSMYVDPGRNPVRFLEALTERYPPGLRQQFVLTQPDGFTADMVTLAGFAVVVALYFGFCRRRRVAGFLLLGSLLSLVPLCTVAIGPRLLFPVSIGACGFLALMLVDSWHVARHGRLWHKPVAGALASLVVIFHVVAPLLLAPQVPRVMADLDAGVAKSAATLPWDDSVAGAALSILNAPNFFRASLELQDRVQRDGAVPRVAYLIGVSEEPVRVTRVHPNVLVLEPRGGYLAETWSTLVRAPGDAFQVGQSVRLAGIIVVVDQVTPDGRPARISLHIDWREGPFAWATWNPMQQRYERIELPEVGQSILLNVAR
jgi:hypothetical protein